MYPMSYEDIAEISDSDAEYLEAIAEILGEEAE